MNKLMIADDWRAMINTEILQSIEVGTSVLQSRRTHRIVENKKMDLNKGQRNLLKMILRDLISLL